jgi:hypothetical protein
VGSAVEWLVGLIGLGGRCERGIWCFDAGHCVDQYRRVKAETRRDCGKESGDAEIARFAEKRFSASFLDLAQQPLEVSRVSSFIGSACTAFLTATAPRSCSRRQMLTLRYAGFAGS